MRYDFDRINAYLHKCIILRHMFGLWRMVSKHVYTAFCQFILRLWRIFSKNVAYRRIITIFLILNLVFESNSELRKIRGPFGFLRQKKFKENFQNFQHLSPRNKYSFWLTIKRLLFVQICRFLVLSAGFWCCIFGHFWRHNVIECLIVFSAYES